MFCYFPIQFILQGDGMAANVIRKPAIAHQPTQKEMSTIKSVTVHIIWLMTFFKGIKWATECFWWEKNSGIFKIIREYVLCCFP